MDCSPLGSSVHRIFQARILEWVTISFSRGSSLPRDRMHISCIDRWILYPLCHQGSPGVGFCISRFGRLQLKKRIRPRYSSCTHICMQFRERWTWLTETDWYSSGRDGSALQLLEKTLGSFPMRAGMDFVGLFQSSHCESLMLVRPVMELLRSQAGGGEPSLILDGRKLVSLLGRRDRGRSWCS